MRILVVTQTGYGIGLGSHLSSDGHHINTVVKPAVEVTHISRLLQECTPDIAVFDSNNHVVPAEWVRTRGVRVLGASSWSNLIDTNTDYKKRLISAIGYVYEPDAVGTGAEVSCWFNGQSFISRSIVFNYTRMMPGDVGAYVDSAGYIAYFKVEDSKLVEGVLGPLSKFLRKANHRGCFTVSVVVKGDGSWVVRDISADVCKAFTQSVFENTRKSKSDVVLSVFNESSEPIPYIEPYVCGVMVSVYPYPHSVPSIPVNIVGINHGNLKHLWLMDLRKSDDSWICGDISGCVGYVTARGKDHFEARRRVYRTIENIKVDGLQYRNDIGSDVGERLFELRKHKLI